jgi:hypothetical protein
MGTVWTRFNSVMLVLVFLALLGVLAMLARDARGGPLDPPAPPSSTNSVRLPGTPISQPADASGFPIVINQPGSYYLTSNINGVANQPGIVITSDNVTLDLMGFTLDGPDGPDQQGGIDNLFVPVKSVTIRNGIIRDWGGGIGLGTSERSNLYDLQVVDNNVYGIDIGVGGIMDGLIVRDNTGLYGITIYQGTPSTSVPSTELRNSVISFNSGDGVIINDANGVWVHDNVLEGNTGDGIELVGNAFSNTISDNRSLSNAGFEVNIGSPNVNVITMQNNIVVRNVWPNGGGIWNGGVSTRVGSEVGAGSATNPWSNLIGP